MLVQLISSVKTSKAHTFVSVVLVMKELAITAYVSGLLSTPQAAE